MGKVGLNIVVPLVPLTVEKDMVMPPPDDPVVKAPAEDTGEVAARREASCSDLYSVLSCFSAAETVTGKVVAEVGVTAAAAALRTSMVVLVGVKVAAVGMG